MAKEISKEELAIINKAARDYVKTLPALNYRSAYDFGIQNINAFTIGALHQESAKNSEIEKLNTIIDELREQKVELQDTLTASQSELTELLLKIDFLTQELSCKSDGSSIDNDYRIELHE